ncbi:mannose-P-dolichol utilization defect 1 protein-like [Hydractinia symbiolongicarpus]|uniref:mannose-P-dolichol utilization defect 1 protein-like n=1 Tax=Hydractinia symbiolongicarpus TaxID=13093 RepID=UPI00254B9AC1|nr:mannose-P-dolichol utilization defect 1 protein-like [Hydractinia symbiolongicarpus]
MATQIVYFFTPLVLLFMSEKCHDEFFIKFNFFDVPCLKMTLSKGLGYGIILGAILVKIPQIIKLVQAKSGVGVSVLSLFAEMTAIMFGVAYAVKQKFPFSSWGESLFIGIQDLILMILIFFYARNYIAIVLFPPVYIGVSTLLSSSFTPDEIVTKLQNFTVFIVAASRFLQIWTNFSNGHTGQLSLITQVLLAAGSLARVFTSVQETGDVFMISQFAVTCLLNCVILAQIFYYWDVAVDRKKKKAE